MSIRVAPTASGFGAAITGVDLAAPIAAPDLATIRSAWLEHQVVYFPDQPLDHKQLEAFTLSMGDFGHDPFVVPLDNHQNILEIRREPNEVVSPFGGSWHSDWSFQEAPPSATILHAKTIPPIGGDTLYADGRAAYDALPPTMQSELEELQAVHSARRPYSPEGYVASGGLDRSMEIVPTNKAWATQLHPVVRTHPETGRKALWINPVYTLSIHGMPEPTSTKLLASLFEHVLQDEFIYTHKWSENMLTMWDNRSVQHCAQGGYDGHLRVLHRTTVAGDIPV